MSKDLLRFREFQFNCWLSWGPSIPICTCPQWHGWNNRPVFQYGYGDEGNSLSVVFNNANTTGELSGYFKSGNFNDVRTDKPLACSVPIKGTLTRARWLERNPSTGSKALCKAQKGILDDNDRLVVQVQESGEAKDRPDKEAGPEKEAGSEKEAGYYSAYLWVMFVIIDSKGSSFTKMGNDAWQYLLPIFEHGNLADRDTYKANKTALVQKALFLANEILQKNLGVSLRYACAFDDANCSVGSRLLCPPLAGQSIKELLEKGRTDTLGNGSCKTHMDRLILDTSAGTISLAEREFYSACHLMERIDPYFKVLDKL